jgi:hypothetical protein
MIRQLPVFDIATTKPTKTKNQKQKQSTRPSQYQLTMFAHSKDLANYTNSYTDATTTTSTW